MMMQGDFDVLLNDLSLEVFVDEAIFIHLQITLETYECERAHRFGQPGVGRSVFGNEQGNIFTSCIDHLSRDVLRILRN